MQRTVISALARRSCLSRSGRSVGSRRFASSNEGGDGDSEGTAAGSAASSQPARNADLQAPFELDLPQDSLESSKLTKSTAPRRRIESLSGELRRQRRAALSEQGVDPDTLLGPEEDGVSEIAPGDIARPYSGRKEPRSHRSSQRRVDLYKVNETGYPQLKPEGEVQERSQRPPQRQRGEQAGITDDALSAMIERPSSSRPRTSAGGQSSSQIEPGRFDRSHNRPVRTARPRDDYVLDGPAGEGNSGERPALQRQQRQPFSRPAQSGSSSSSNTSGFGAAPTQRYGRVSTGPSGDRRAGPSSGPGGRPGQRPGQRPQQRRRGPPVSAGTSKAARKLPSPPARVIDNSGQYSLASSVPASVSSSSPSVISAIHASQWRSNKQDIQNAHLSPSAKPDTLAKIVKGDWQAYMAPVFQPQKHTAKEKVGGAGSLITQKGARQALLERVRRAMVNNGSVRLKGKVEVVQKIEAAV